MLFNVVLAHTEPNHSNFLSRLLFHTDMGWLLAFVGIVIVVVVINKFSATASDEQFNQEG